MWHAEKRLKRDRNFITYNDEKHFIRAFSLIAQSGITFDLFSPVQGYRKYNDRPHSPYVSPKRQHKDWSDKVMQRDDNVCQNCKAIDELEAHHIWPQSWFPNLRYIIANGITLCRECHDKAYHATEITPFQCRELLKTQELINMNIETSDFWENYTAGLEKGRIILHNMSTDEFKIKPNELEWFVEWASYNYIIERTNITAKNAPIIDNEYSLNIEITEMIMKHQIEKHVVRYGLL